MKRQANKCKVKFGKRLNEVRSWFSRAIQYISVSIFIGLTTLSPAAFADGDTTVDRNGYILGYLETKIFGSSSGGVFGQIYSLLATISLPIAAVILAVNAFQFMFNSEDEAAAAKRRMVIVCVAVIIVLLAPRLITAVPSLFSTDSSGSWINKT